MKSRTNFIKHMIHITSISKDIMRYLLIVILCTCAYGCSKTETCDRPHYISDGCKIYSRDSNSQLGEGSPTFYHYDKERQRVDSIGSYFYEYNDECYLDAIWDDNTWRILRYDDEGRILRTTSSTVSGCLFKYNDRGQVIELNNEKTIYKFSYYDNTNNIDTVIQDNTVLGYITDIYVYEYDTLNHPMKNIHVLLYQHCWFPGLVTDNNVIKETHYFLTSIGDTSEIINKEHLITYNEYGYPLIDSIVSDFSPWPWVWQYEYQDCDEE